MTRVDPKYTRVALSGPEWPEKAQSCHIKAQSGVDWTREGLKCAIVAQGSLEWRRLDHSGADWTREGLKWPRVAPERPRVDQREPEMY